MGGFNFFGPERAIQAAGKLAAGADPGFFGPMMIESNLNSGALEPLSSLPSNVFGVPTLGQELGRPKTHSPDKADIPWM